MARAANPGRTQSSQTDAGTAGELRPGRKWGCGNGSRGVLLAPRAGFEPSQQATVHRARSEYRRDVDDRPKSYCVFEAVFDSPPSPPQPRPRPIDDSRVSQVLHPSAEAVSILVSCGASCPSPPVAFPGARPHPGHAPGQPSYAPSAAGSPSGPPSQLWRSGSRPAPPVPPSSSLAG